MYIFFCSASDRLTTQNIRNIGRPVSGRATNNCGEIQASTMAIRMAGDCGIQKLCINTDSQFLINSVTKWMTNWKTNNWRVKKGQPVKNVKDFKELDKVISQYQIILKWVRPIIGWIA